MKPIHTISAIIFLAPAVSLSAAPAVSAVDHAAHMAADPVAHPSTAETSSGDPALSHDLAAMREKVAKLETALGSKNGAPADSAGMAMPGQASAAGAAGMANSDQGTISSDQGKDEHGRNVDEWRFFRYFRRRDG